MYGREDPAALAAKPGGWTELALTLPVFRVVQLGVLFRNVRNATDIVTVRLLEFWPRSGNTICVGGPHH